jgi:hypothetical protein
MTNLSKRLDVLEAANDSSGSAPGARPPLIPVETGESQDQALARWLAGHPNRQAELDAAAACDIRAIFLVSVTPRGREQGA